MSNHIGEVTRVVVCAAWRYGDVIICSPRHLDNTARLTWMQLKNPPDVNDVDQGFVDQWGVFMNRFEALEVATKAGQINVRRTKTQPEDRLFSEDLY